MYEVKTEKFTGPLGKLLELIEEKKLEITTINLAEVTGDFLRYVKELGVNNEAGIVADFLVVAAKLVLIKSKVLLPMLELTKEEEEDIRDLEGRLRIYREFKVAAEHLKKLWDKRRISYGRELLKSLGDYGGLPAGRQVFYPPKELGASDLVRAVNQLALTLQALIPETQTVKREVVTIEQKMEELLNRFKQAGAQSFRTMAQQKSRQEVIVLFLAILHLLKDRVVKVSQGAAFSDITVEKKHESEITN